MLCNLGSIVTYASAAVAAFAGLAMAEIAPAVSYNNTLVYQRADPQVLKHTDGWYYFTGSVPAYDKVVLRRSQTIQGLSDAEEVTVWDRAKSTAGVGYVWAPELHWIGDKWYIYFALGRRSEFDIRMFVIEGEGENPLTAAWTEKPFIGTDYDTFSLDATTFEADGVRYLCWAQADPRYDNGAGTSLFLAKMDSPWTIVRPTTVVSRPALAWERIGHFVNEGAYVIQRNGRIFMTYSASATDHNYAVGLLTAPQGADLTDASVWTKAQQPVLKSNERTSQYGPGHNSFTLSEDGLSDLIVYHARQYKDIVGEPLYNPDRHARVQKLYWREDGTPDFGIPVPDGLTPVRLRAFGCGRSYLKHNENAAATLEGGVPVELTQFRIVEAGDNVRLEATSFPGRFLSVAEDASLRLVAEPGADADFVQAAGLADEAGVSFESAGRPGEFIHAESGVVVVKALASDKDNQGATFYTE